MYKIRNVQKQQKTLRMNYCTDSLFCIFKRRTKCNHCQQALSPRQNCRFIRNFLLQIKSCEEAGKGQNLYQYYCDLQIKQSLRYQLAIRNSIKQLQFKKVPYIGQNKQVGQQLFELLNNFVKFTFQTSKTGFQYGMEWIGGTLLYHGDVQSAFQIMAGIWKKLAMQQIYTQKGQDKFVNKVYKRLKLSSANKILSKEEIHPVYFFMKHLGSLLLSLAPIQQQAIILQRVIQEEWQFIYRACVGIIQIKVKSWNRQGKRCEAVMQGQIEWQQLFQHLRGQNYI